MTNQQLLSFIKQQLQQGLTKEKISDELLANGWTSQDIEEGFNAVYMQSPNMPSSIPKGKKHSGLRISLIILLVLIAGTASAFYFKNDLKNLPILGNFLPSPSQPAPNLSSNQINPIGSTNPASPETQTPIEPINCAPNDMDCIITAAQSCSPAVVEWTATINLFGLLQTNKSKIALTGFDSSNKCVFSSLVENANLSMSPEAKAQAKAKGATDAQIEKQLQVANVSAQQTVGMTTTCSLTTNDLTKLLTNWSKGNSSSSDLASGNCTVIDKSGKSLQSNTGQPISLSAPSTTQPKDCGSSDSCFSDSAKTCAPAKATISNQSDGQTLTYVETIKGYEEDNCILTLGYTASPVPGFVGKDMTCQVPKANLADFKDYLQGNNMKQSCSGPLVDFLIKLGAK